MLFLPARSGCPWLLWALLFLGGCGGGGSGGGATGGNGNPTQPPPNGTNRAPVMRAASSDQVAFVGHPFQYDVNQGGRFYDPDDDTLTYEYKFSGFPDRPPPWIAISGSQLSGTPTETSLYIVEVTVADGRGGTLKDTFNLDIRLNSPPSIANANQNQIVALGNVSYDAAQGGSTFTDADGHALSYQVSIVASSVGFSVQGTRIVGNFAAPGFVKARIRATDDFGGAAEDVFALVVPEPISTRPRLPSPTFVYDDAALPLPHVFRMSRLNGGPPLWDTTPTDNVTSNAGATLGRVLFYDRRLSITNTHSCASCHEQARGFAGSQRFGVGVFGEQTRRNPMALANVRYNSPDQFFMDQRVMSLERLALIPIQDAIEMGSPLPLLEAELAATDFYPPLFQAAFGTPGVSSERIAKALAQFLRSLISYRSRFDQAFSAMDIANPPDPASVLTAQELRGAEVFSDGRCFFCHATNAHAMPNSANTGLDVVSEDPGVRAGWFRTASLRNIALSAPYMHDGRFATLREVIEFYNSGINANPELSGILGGGRPEGPMRLNLSEADKDALEAFLNTLTDNALVTDPKFSDPFQ